MFLCLIITLSLIACGTEKTASEIPTFPVPVESIGEPSGPADSPFTVTYDNYDGIIADAVPVSDAELENRKGQPVVSMYRTLINSYRRSSEEYAQKTTHFTLADVDANGIPDLLLRTDDLIFVISYDDLAEKEPHVNFLHNVNCNLLEDGSIFTCYREMSTNAVNIGLERIHINRMITTADHSTYMDTIIRAHHMDMPDAHYIPTGMTKDEWLQALRARNLRHAYWYEFTDENIRKYLPCDTLLPFTCYSFTDYDSLLKTCYHLALRYNICKIEPYYQGKFDILYDCSTQESYDKYLFVKNLIFNMYPKALGASYPAEDAIGYAKHDLNGDGIDELLLFNGGNYWLDAVFTWKDGVPVYDPTDYGFTQVSYDRQLAYWKETVGIEVLPLFPESDRFDFPAPDNGK